MQKRIQSIILATKNEHVPPLCTLLPWMDVHVMKKKKKRKWKKYKKKKKNSIVTQFLMTNISVLKWHVPMKNALQIFKSFISSIEGSNDWSAIIIDYVF